MAREDLESSGQESSTANVIDAAHLEHQRDWSKNTFGPQRIQGVVDHIRKELKEIEQDPTDIKEWVDVIILGFDGAWRAGADPQELLDAIKAKQALNEKRVWPDWRTVDPNSAIEHNRVNDRPDWDTYFLIIARTVALRADCSRRRCGAVIVKHNRIVSTGYNGSPAGGPSCLRGECPRGTKSFQEVKSFLEGNHDFSDCIAIHAESNAIAYANREDTEGATIYITAPPCDMCDKLIKAAGIVRVVHD